ncbi:MAG TPA: hypothetical protein VJI69_06575 [Bacteroidia bacterium]|nr:hypothetical protein [Bacteroidia bacterium]
MMKSIYIAFLFCLLFACNSSKDKIAEQDRLAAKYADSMLAQQQRIDSLLETAIEQPCLYVDSINKRFSFTKEIKAAYVVSYKSVPTFGSAKNPARSENGIVKDNKLVYTDFKEKIKLSNKQLDSLQKILFNYQASSGSYRPADCYFPRHCIYFEDGSKKVVAYLEICFECNQRKSAHEELLFTCTEQFKDLQNFLQCCGIKKGFNINSMDPASGKDQ